MEDHLDEQQQDPEQPKKKVVSEGEKGQQSKKVKKVDPKHQEEQEKLLFDADQISPIGKRKKINKAEIVKTMGGEEINLADYIEENYITGKSTHYFKEQFYYPLADMFGVPRKVMDEFVKPYFVPVFKNAFILSRFPQRVVNRIQEKNPYVSYWYRRYFHYQFLTKTADVEYRLFISQAQEIMNRVPKPTVKEFINEYCDKYNVPKQLSLFDDFLEK